MTFSLLNDTNLGSLNRGPAYDSRSLARAFCCVGSPDSQVLTLALIPLRMSAVCPPPSLPSAPMKYVHLPLLQYHKLTALAKESNISSVDNPSSTQVESTLHSDEHVRSYCPGLASSAVLDRLGFEPAQPPKACYSTY